MFDRLKPFVPMAYERRERLLCSCFDADTARSIPESQRPTETRNAAMGVVRFLTSMGLFIGQSQQFLEMLRDLASNADAARRTC
jgi:hypothetical protein